MASVDPGGSRVPRSSAPIDWNAQLPYFAPSTAGLFGATSGRDAYEAEAKSQLADIAAGLAAAVADGDWYGGRVEGDARVGVLGWTNRLVG